MTKYSGKPAIVAQPRQQIFDKVSNLSSFQERLDSMPQEVKDRLGDVKFTDDKIIINAPAVGQLVFAVTEKVAPELLKLSAENSPVPFFITLHFAPESETTTKVNSDLEVEIPMMLRPMVGGKLQEAADKFSEMFTTLFGG